MQEQGLDVGEYSGVLLVTAAYFVIYYSFLFAQSFHRIFLEHEKVKTCVE